MLKTITSRVPLSIEVSLVLTLCFGLPAIGSVYNLVSGKAFQRVEINDAKLAMLLVYEVIVGSIVISLLYLRGYKLWQRLEFHTTLKHIGVGILSAIGIEISYFAVWIILNLTAHVLGETLAVPTFSVQVSLVWIVLGAVINPMFEEAFLLGYVLDRLQMNSVWIFIGLTTGIRVSYHLYQGWVGIAGLVPTGIIIGLVYWKTRNLMPVYLCHMLLDFVGLSISQ